MIIYYLGLMQFILIHTTLIYKMIKYRVNMTIFFKSPIHHNAHLWEERKGLTKAKKEIRAVVLACIPTPMTPKTQNRETRDQRQGSSMEEIHMMSLNLLFLYTSRFSHG